MLSVVQFAVWPHGGAEARAAGFGLGGELKCL